MQADGPREAKEDWLVPKPGGFAALTMTGPGSRNDTYLEPVAKACVIKPDEKKFECALGDQSKNSILIDD